MSVVAVAGQIRRDGDVDSDGDVAGEVGGERDGVSRSGSDPRAGARAGPGATLPAYVSRLMDPSAMPDLPSVVTGLSRDDNAALDRIIGTMAKHRATWTRSVLLFDWLVEHGHEVDERLCATVIRLCTSRGNPSKALEVYKWMRLNRVPCSLFTYTSVMKAALVGGDIEYALDVFKQASDAIPNEKMDSHIHTLLIEALDRKGDIEQALQVFNDVQEGGASVPSVQVCTATMKAASNAGKVDEAVEIWNDMKLKGTKPSAHAYATIIHVHGRAGDWKEAMHKFDEMINRGIRADVVSCTALVDALATNGAWTRAERFMEWMRRQRIHPNVRTYSVLVGAYVKHAEFARASALFDQMQSGALGLKNRPNEFTYSVLIKRLGEKGKWEEAESVFMSLQRAILDKKASSDHSGNERPGGYPGAGTVPRVGNKSTRTGGPSVNAVVCSSMMYAYERSGQWKKALELLDISDALGYRDNVVIRNIALSALAKAGQMAKAEEIFAGISAPDGVSFETMVAGYGLVGQCTEAATFMKGMRAAGFKPNDYSYCALIAGHSRNGSFTEALGTFNRAREAGINSVHLYNAMIASCDRFYKYDKAVQLLEEMNAASVERNGVTKHLAVGIGESGVATVQSQQEAILALTAITAAAGGALMRLGVF